MNVTVTSIGEREVSLSWLSNSNDKITAIEVNIYSALGTPLRLVLGNVNSTTITGLMPFREYKFSIAVVNCASPSEVVNITVRTLSLGIRHIN